MSNNPLFVQDPTLQYDASDFRFMIGNIFAEGVANVGAGGLLVTPRAAGANMSVDVAPGGCYITGDDIAGQGVYQLRWDTKVNLPIAAAPSSGTRIDLVVARIRDAQVIGTGATVSDRIVVTGSAGAGVPTLPANCVPLAQITVAAGTVSISASQIGDQRGQASLLALSPIRKATGIYPTFGLNYNTVIEIATGFTPDLVFLTGSGGFCYYHGAFSTRVARSPSTGQVFLNSGTDVTVNGNGFSFRIDQGVSDSASGAGGVYWHAYKLV